MKHKLVRRKVTKRRNSDRPNNKRLVQPRSLEEFFAMPKQDQEIWTKASKAVTEVRAGASLRHASRELDLDPRKISQLARSGLRKMKNGRWAAKKFDRLLRVLFIPTREGLREIGVRDSRQATPLAFMTHFWIAVFNQSAWSCFTARALGTDTGSSR